MKKIGVYIISFYQNIFRLLLSAIGISSSCCFTPTCSEYTKQAIVKYGLFLGIWLGVKRILRCWGCRAYSHDPLD